MPLKDYFQRPLTNIAIICMGVAGFLYSDNLCKKIEERTIDPNKIVNSQVYKEQYNDLISKTPRRIVDFYDKIGVETRLDVAGSDKLEVVLPYPTIDQLTKAHQTNGTNGDAAHASELDSSTFDYKIRFAKDTDCEKVFSESAKMQRNSGRVDTLKELVAACDRLGVEVNSSILADYSIVVDVTSGKLDYEVDTGRQIKNNGIRDVALDLKIPPKISYSDFRRAMLKRYN